MASEAIPDDELRRARAELIRLRAENQRLAELLEMAQDAGRLGVWERDPRTLEGRWDRHVFRFFGYAPGETPSFLEAARRIHPDDRRPDEVRATLGTPGKHSSHFRVLRPDGTVAHLHSRWQVVTDAQGQPERVIGVMVDDSAAHDRARHVAAEHAQLQLALALSGIGLWRHELESDLLFQDERAQAMVGRDAAAQGVPLEIVRGWIHPDDVADVQAAFDATLATGGPIDTQTRYHHSDGRWRTVLTRRLLMRDAGGEPSMILGVALDVTEQQRRTTEALQLARRLEAAAEAARVGLWSGAIDATRPEWNAYMYTLLARDPAQQPLSPGEALREYTLAEDRDRVAGIALEWLRGPAGQPLDFEMRIRRGDGEPRWVQIRAQREIDADGSDRAFGIMQDVTVEHEAMERLRVANERTALALTAVNMGTWSHDVVSGRDDWDDQMFRLRGLTPGAAVPNREQRMALVLPEDRHAADTQAMPFTTSAAPLAYEFRIVRANDGAVRTLASRSMALTDAHGNVTRRIGVNWDVTEIRSVERVQRERELALRENRTKSALFARISHELRTPLNAVLGFAQLMHSEDAQATTAQRQHRLAQIQAAGKSLLALVDNVLDLSEQADALRDTVRTPVLLADALDQAVAAVTQAARSRGVRIEFGDMSPVVAADARRLQQLLAQLLGNAVKFSRPQGAVHLGARVVGGEAVLVIEDSGPGIDAERARRLFEPFEGPGGAVGEATGIGLAIGQALAQRMGGRIELASTGPGGSLFELWLPLAKAPSTPSASASRRLAPSLLYIEDNDVNMLIVRELLAQRPRVVFHGAVDGTSGVHRARELLPSLVLIDMQLPDINGVEVLRQLRADPLTASIPCVALSANAMPEDVQSARAAGFDDYWTKPIDLSAFLRALDRLLPTV
jgi:signal transduction histidine kinase/ActR/RegA family two-component response regulator